MDNLAKEVERLTTAFVEEVLAGGDIQTTRAKLIADNPSLQPELERQLRLAEAILITAAKTNVGPTPDSSQPTLAVRNEEAVTQFVPEERVENLNCPHCGNRIKLVSRNLGDITCNNCGSIITIQAGVAATPFRQAPTSIGRFKIISFLGSGGFGTAYLAHDPTLGREVALKVPRAREFATANERERFIREAKHAANLRHENIVQVYEVNTEGEFPYIVSQYIDGMTLAERSMGTAIPYREIARLMLLIAQAVHHAHEKGIIHRDLKPSNILLDSAHKPFVADFGLARNLSADQTMTVEGEILGTPAYMSPEQADGKLSQISVRSDVYSLGVILYRLLCRENPFRATGRMLIQQVIHEEPVPPRRIDDSIPLDLETITLKAMNKNPELRYESAKALAEDLWRWQTDQAILARPETSASKVRRWCRRNPKIASLLSLVASLLLVVSVLSSVWAWRERILKIRAERLQQVTAMQSEVNQRQVVAAAVSNSLSHMESGVYGRSMLWNAAAIKNSIDNAAMHRIRAAMLWKNHPRLTLVNSTGSSVKKIRFSPKGDYLLAGNKEGVLAKLACDNPAEESIMMPHTSDIVDIKVSSDQQRLLSFTKNSPVATLRHFERNSPIAQLEHTSPVASADFSPDGQTIATADRSGIIKLWKAQTGALLFEFFCGESSNQLVRTTFVDNDRLLTFRQAITPEEVTQVSAWKLSATGSEKEYSLDTNAIDAYPQVASNTLIVSQFNLQLGIYDLQTGSAKDARPTTDSLVIACDYLPGQDRFLTVELDGSLTLWSLTGQRLKTVQHSVGVLDSVVDRHGNFVAVAGTDGLVSVYWVHLLQKLGTDLVADESVSCVAFNPDGRRLSAGGASGIVRVWDLAGLAPDVPLLNHAGPVNVARFNQSGSHVVSASSDRTARIWNAGQGSAVGDPIAFDDQVMDASLDNGRDLAVAGSLDGTIQFFQVATGQAVGDRIAIGDGVTKVQFHPTNSSWAVIGGAAGSVSKVHVTDGKVAFKLNDVQRTITDLQFSPTGDRILVASADRTATLRSFENGQAVTTPLRHNDPVTRCGFAPDGLTIWTCSTDRGLRFWKTTSPFDSQKRDFLTWPTCVDFTSTGSYITTTNEGEVARWDDSQVGWKTSYRAYQFRHCQIDDNDKLALVCGESSVARTREQGSGIALLLDATSGQPVSPPLRHFGGVNKAFFDAAGRRIVTAAEDHTARIWEISQDDRPAEEIYQYSVILSGSEINDAAQSVPLPPRQIVELFTAAYENSPAAFACQPDEIDRWNAYVQWVTTRH